MNKLKVRFSVLFVCSILVAGVFSIPAFADGQTLGNGGYPYGSHMSANGFTLNIVVEGADEATSYQWQSSDTEAGTYTDITDEHDASFTTSSAIPGTWYRCVVNDTLTSNAVQVVQVVNGDPDPGQIQVIQMYDYTERWYISNGVLAYTSVSNGNATTNFDVIGKYTRDDTSLWINTTYSYGWQLFTSTSAEPQSMASGSLYSGNAQLDALMFAFDADNSHVVKIAADLAANEQAFALGSDVMLGVDYMFSGYEVADEASLKAIIKNDAVSQIQMVGAESIATALESDPAFVLKFQDAPSCYWLGAWNARNAFAFNLDGDSNTIEEVCGTDSGMTASWMNVTAGDIIRFEFNVGSVSDTGAALEATSECTSTTITILDPDPDFYYSIYSADGQTLIKEWTCSDEAGTPLVFTDLDSDTEYLIKAIAKSEFNGKPDESQDGPSAVEAGATTAIDPIVPTNPDTEVTVDETPDSIVLKGLNPDYEYTLEDASGNPIKGWQKPDAQGTLVFSDLDPDTEYYLAARSDTNTGSDRVPISTAALPQESTPNASIDFEHKQLRGLVPGEIYLLNGQEITASAQGTLDLDDSLLGTVLMLIKKGDGVTTNNSEAQQLLYQKTPDSSSNTNPATSNNLAATGDSYGAPGLLALSLLGCALIAFSLRRKLVL